MKILVDKPPDNEQTRCWNCKHWTFIPDDFDYPTPYSEGKCGKWSTRYNYTSYGGWCNKWKKVT